MTYFAKLKKFFWFFVKLAIAGGIVAYLAFKNPTEIIDGFRSFNYIWLVPALLFYLLHMLVCAWRWHRLTRILGVRLSGFEALSLTMQGYFFSLVIPGGAIGGFCDGHVEYRKYTSWLAADRDCFGRERFGEHRKDMGGSRRAIAL